jgi:hypothetical protein
MGGVPTSSIADKGIDRSGAGAIRTGVFFDVPQARAFRTQGFGRLRSSYGDFVALLLGIVLTFHSL